MNWRPISQTKRVHKKPLLSFKKYLVILNMDDIYIIFKDVLSRKLSFMLSRVNIVL